MIDIFYNRRPALIAKTTPPEFINEIINESLIDDVIANTKLFKSKLIVVISNPMLDRDYELYLDDYYIKSKSGRLFKIVFNENKKPILIKTLSEIAININVNVYECVNRDSLLFPLFKRWMPIRNTIYPLTIHWK